MDKTLFDYLQKNEIHYILHNHDAVFTVQEAKEKSGSIPGLHCKNLFLKNSKTKTYFLVSLPATKNILLLDLSKKLQMKKLSFASPDELAEILYLKPGSVSPFGLVNDNENKVIFIIDNEVWSAKKVCFHPNVNTETLEIDKTDFQKFVKTCGNTFEILDL